MTTRRSILISASLLTLCASVAVAQLPVRTVANLPTALCTSGELENHLFAVSDGDAAGDCSTGAGSTLVVCACDGGAWTAGALWVSSGISDDGDVLIEATGTDHDVALEATGDVELTATDDVLITSTDDTVIAATGLVNVTPGESFAVTTTAGAVTLTAGGTTQDASLISVDDIFLTAGDDVVIAPTGLLNITPGETATITTTSGAISLNANGSAVELAVSAGSTVLTGAVKLAASSAPPVACSAGTEGTIYVDSDIHKACICNATAYVLMNDDSTTTGCS